MGKIWWSEMELFQRLLQLQRRSHATLASERKARVDEKATMQARIEALEREVADLRAGGAYRRPRLD